MPLNTTFFANTTDVREKATNVLDTDFPDAEIEEEQEYAVDRIKIAIGSYDQNHQHIMTLKNIEIYFAASFIVDNHSGSKDDVDRLYNKGELLLKDLKESQTGTGVDTGFLSARSVYTTPMAARLDDSATTVRSYKSTSTYIGLDAELQEIDRPTNPLMDSNAPEDLINPGACKIWY